MVLKIQDQNVSAKSLLVGWLSFDAEYAIILKTELNVIYRVGQKTWHQTHGHNSVNSFQILSLEYSLENLPHNLVKHVYFATLWNINVRKQAINDKLQGSVATYLTCGGVANDQIKKGLLLSLSVKKIWNWWIFGKVTNKKVLLHKLRCPWQQQRKGEEFTRHFEYGEKQLSLTVVTQIFTLNRKI